MRAIWRGRSRRFRVLAAALLGLLVWLAGDFFYVIDECELDQARPSDVILVLGCPSLKDGALSACVQVRAHHAADLYKQGLARAIIPTGGVTGPGPSEAQAMAAVLQADGVPASAILLEDRARDTVENIRYSRALMQAHGWHSAILVTEPHHIKRGLLIARDGGLTVVPSPALASASWHVPAERAHNVLRDTLALMLYQVRRLVGRGV
jgi:uncharacterized SAM-binding protein YcdF (DUF218 family)